MNEFSLATNPADTNWRSYIFDKQAWGMGPINNITINQNKMFVSGYFSQRFYDSLIFNGLAELQDSIWVPLGSGDSVGVRGIFPIINDILLRDSILYVAGLFDTVGFITANNIACWNSNSNTWTSIGKGTNGIVTSLSFKDSILYVGGNFDSLFTNSDTIRACNIAKWNGTQWDSLGSGLNGSVYNMSWSGKKLYVIGSFDSIGTTQARYIGIWNDSTETWSSFGNDGPIGELTAVCTVGNNVYFGGFFDSVKVDNDTIICHNIVKWNGSSWDSLGNGIDGWINQLTTNGTDLFVVGDFSKTFSDTLVCRNISMWDADNWIGFGSGTDGFIYAIAFKGDSILVGGSFHITGDTTAAENIGLWYKPSSPQQANPNDIKNISDNSSYLKVFPNPFSDETTFEFYLENYCKVEIKLIDVLGKELETIVNKVYEPGWHRLLWKSNRYSSGIYLCKMVVGNKIISTKLIISK